MALAELAERTFRATFASQNTAEDMEAHCRKSYGREIQAAEIAEANRTTLLCEADGNLIGYGQLRWNGAPACVAARNPAEIQRLYVDAGWHGKGVAVELMAELLPAASEGRADVVWLGVWEKNPRAISFYEKSGFERAGEHVFVVGNDPQRDLVLVKRPACREKNVTRGEEHVPHHPGIGRAVVEPCGGGAAVPDEAGEGHRAVRARRRQ